AIMLGAIKRKVEQFIRTKCHPLSRLQALAIGVNVQDFENRQSTLIAKAQVKATSQLPNGLPTHASDANEKGGTQGHAAGRTRSPQVFQTHSRSLFRYRVLGQDAGRRWASKLQFRAPRRPHRPRLFLEGTASLRFSGTQ